MPLRDIVVLDLTRARAGPTAVRQLADWGSSGEGRDAACRTRAGWQTTVTDSIFRICIATNVR